MNGEGGRGAGGDMLSMGWVWKGSELSSYVCDVNKSFNCALNRKDRGQYELPTGIGDMWRGPSITGDVG